MDTYSEESDLRKKICIRRSTLADTQFAELSPARLRSEHACPAIVDAMDGFSGADLKRVVQDAKLNLAVI